MRWLRSWGERRDENARMDNWWAANTEPGPEPDPRDIEAGQYTDLADRYTRQWSWLQRLVRETPGWEKQAYHYRPPPWVDEDDQQPGDLYPPEDWGTG